MIDESQSLYMLYFNFYGDLSLHNGESYQYREYFITGERIPVIRVPLGKFTLSGSPESYASERDKCDDIIRQLIQEQLRLSLLQNIVGITNSRHLPKEPGHLVRDNDYDGPLNDLSVSNLIYQLRNQITLSTEKLFNGNKLLRGQVAAVLPQDMLTRAGNSAYLESLFDIREEDLDDSIFDVMDNVSDTQDIAYYVQAEKRLSFAGMLLEISVKNTPFTPRFVSVSTTH